jgi:hypothetical protein
VDKPETKVNIPLFYLYEISRLVKFIETENRMMVARCWEEGEMEGYYSEFYFGKIKIFQRWMIKMHIGINVLHDTELCTQR